MSGRVRCVPDPNSWNLPFGPGLTFAFNELNSQETRNRFCVRAVSKCRRVSRRVREPERRRLDAGTPRLARGGGGRGEVLRCSSDLELRRHRPSPGIGAEQKSSRFRHEASAIAPILSPRRKRWTEGYTMSLQTTLAPKRLQRAASTAIHHRR